MDRKTLLSRAKSLHILSSKLLEGLLSGTYRSVFKGPGIEFDEVRDYTDNDDIRMIDWNVTSRMGTPYTKTFREEREIVLFLLIDVSASMYVGSAGEARIDTASELAALLVFAAVQNDDQIGVLFFSDKIEKWIPPAKGKSHASRIIRDLVTIEPEGTGSDLALAGRSAYETMKRRGVCVILSDFRTNPGKAEVSLLSRKHDVIALRVIDQNEFTFPTAGFVELRDPESGATLSVRGGAGRFRREFHDFWRAEHALWERDYRRVGAATLTVGIDDDPAKELIRFFNARKRRKIRR